MVWLHAFLARKTVSAIAYAVCAQHGMPGAAAGNGAARFVARELELCPAYLRAPLLLLTLIFELSPILRQGRSFCRLPMASRIACFERARLSRLRPWRDFAQFYESLVLVRAFGAQEKSEERPSPLPSAPAPPSEALPGYVEVCVIGSGPGGALTAALLAEAGKEVLLIEEGPFRPLESCTPFGWGEMQQKYRHGGITAFLGQPKIAYVEGRGVGGGSEVNAGLYHRTPPSVLAHWRETYGLREADDASLEAHFLANEKDLSVQLSTGPLPLASLKLHEGACRLGWASQEVPRWYTPEGTRQSMTKTFVPRALAAGAQLRDRTRAERLERQSAGWTVHTNRGPVRARTVFVSAGATQTPALLRRSGVGRNVGRGLQAHPTVKVTALFPERVNHAGLGVAVHQVKEFSPRLGFGCSISSPAHLALSLLQHREALAQLPQNWERMAIYYAMIQPLSRARMRYLPGVDAPLLSYPLAAQDHANLGEGLAKLSQILFAAGAERLYPSVEGMAALEPTKPFPAPPSPRRLQLMTVHLFSSCAMGENRNLCTADSFGKVHGEENLFLADASMLCSAPGVNPQGSVMAFARRNALRFLART